jgi:hypothetical protein
MSDLRVDEPSFVGTTVAEPATSTLANFSRPQRNRVATGVVLAIGLTATVAWASFLAWACGKIAGLW